MTNSNTNFSTMIALVALILTFTFGFPASASNNLLVKTTTPFAQVEKNLTQAIKNNKMGLVCKASATRGAASLGIKIKENRVFGIFHPKYAVRMLEASVAAGIEAPIRVYLYENDDGSATIAYKKPSDVFRPYGSADLDKMAQELDTIFAQIVNDAVTSK
ncbi:DUF302 domain-containing protein [Pseudomonadota bacterium]